MTDTATPEGDVPSESFRVLVKKGWFRARHLRLVIDAWPDAIVKPLIRRKGWVLFVIRHDDADG